jgi:hypothetical protein
MQHKQHGMHNQPAAAAAAAARRCSLCSPLAILKNNNPGRRQGRTSLPQAFRTEKRPLLRMSTKGSKAPVQKILSYVRPFQPILPEIEKPKKKVELKERLLWTLVVLFVYLVCCQVDASSPFASCSASPPSPRLLLCLPPPPASSTATPP